MLEIPMHDALPMCFVERVGYLPGNPETFFEWKPVRPDVIGQGRTLGQLHYEHS